MRDRVVPLQYVQDRQIEAVEAVTSRLRHQHHRNRDFFAF
jgi:hypothetical protein